MDRTSGVTVRTIAVITGVVFAVVPVTAQVDQALSERLSLPPFYVDALVFAGSDSLSSRLDVYVQVPYQGLSFVKTDELYSASYEETISVFGADNNLIAEKLSTENIRQKKFAETIDPQRYDLKQKYFHVAPGRYNLVVQVRD